VGKIIKAVWEFRLIGLHKNGTNMITERVNMEENKISIVKKLNREKFFSKRPAFLFKMGGIAFYEHPVYGDGYPIIADDGKLCGVTDYYDRPVELQGKIVLEVVA
jgi:hypothetical protein